MGGGYKAEAGCNGDLCGPVHEVSALQGALALATQESSGEVKLTTGSGHLVTSPLLHTLVYGKREAEADPYIPFGRMATAWWATACLTTGCWVAMGMSGDLLSMARKTMAAVESSAFVTIVFWKPIKYIM